VIAMARPDRLKQALEIIAPEPARRTECESDLAEASISPLKQDMNNTQRGERPGINESMN